MKTFLLSSLIVTLFCGLSFAQSAHKPANESRTTSQVSIDSDLSLPVTVGVYAVDGVLNFSCDPNAGVKFGFTVDVSGAEIESQWTQLNALFYDTTNETLSARQLPSSGQQTIEISGSDAYAVVIHGTIKVNAAGTWSLVWAQRNASETPTELGKGSYLKLTPVS